MTVAGYAGARGAVWLSGDGALDFLHRLTTASTDTLAQGRGVATLLLTDTGRVVDELAVYAGADGVLLITTSGPAAPVVAARLRAHVLYGDEVRVTDATGQVAVLTVVSGTSDVDAMLATLPGVAPDPGGAPAPVPGAPATDWLRIPYSGDEIWRLAQPAEPLGTDIVVPISATEQVAGELAIAWQPAVEYDRLRVELGAPAFGAELGTEAAGNPHELGLMAYVDSTKGCYVGQEVVARLDTYSKVQRALVRVRGEGLALAARIAAPGSRGRPGLVTTAPVESDRALALVPLPVAVGDELEVRTSAGELTTVATVDWRVGV